MISKRLRIVSLLMACMVFISTSMHSMGIHYCNGHFAGVKLFKMEVDSDTVTSCCIGEVNQCTSSADKGCCDDEIIHLDWDTDIASSVKVDFDVTIVDALLNTSTFHSAEILSTRSILPQHYIPPLLNPEKHISFQQFLL